MSRDAKSFFPPRQDTSPAFLFCSSLQTNTEDSSRLFLLVLESQLCCTVERRNKQFCAVGLCVSACVMLLKFDICTRIFTPLQFWSENRNSRSSLAMYTAPKAFLEATFCLPSLVGTFQTCYSVVYCCFFFFFFSTAPNDKTNCHWMLDPCVSRLDENQSEKTRKANRGV